MVTIRIILSICVVAALELKSLQPLIIYVYSVPNRNSSVDCHRRTDS